MKNKFNNYFSTLVENLDPVGKEDKDINNDGKVDSTDEYLKNRREKIAQAIAHGKQEEEETTKAHANSKHMDALEIWDMLLAKKKYSPSEAIEVINLAKAAFEHNI